MAQVGNEKPKCTSIIFSFNDLIKCLVHLYLCDLSSKIKLICDLFLFFSVCMEKWPHILMQEYIFLRGIF